MASKNSGYRPGQKVPQSGQYEQLGPKGGVIKEVTGVKGEPFPPTPRPGGSYKLTDPTKNKSGRP